MFKLKPKDRLKTLISKSSVDVSKSIPAIRYFRSGVEMVRMAKIYLDEGELESAYVLYVKYITLFLEKIPKHPEYASVPESQKIIAKENIKIIFPEAEKLKNVLLQKFEREFNEWKQKEEIGKKKEKEREYQKVLIEPSAPSSSLLLDSDSSIEFKETYNLYKGLRNIYVPKSLIPQFLELAKKNTLNNIETCGLLTGTLQRDRLTITVLLIPEQRGSSDDCSAENDLATFNVIEGRGLLTLGWIHTHPSQQAFLSSVDLHSQFGYQSMLPEAVAIVCAPKYSNEVFRLTEMGLDMIGKCYEKGFHPHQGPTLFEVASHANIVDIPCEVIDLRNA